MSSLNYDFDESCTKERACVECGEKRTDEYWPVHTCNTPLCDKTIARLRRMADAFAADNRVGQCACCNAYVHEGIGKHTATCDVAVHLNLPRETV